MPDHTIAENLARLQAARTNISTAITTKGGTVPSGAGFEDFPTAIASIPEGTDDHDLFGVPTTAQNPKLFTDTFTTTGTTTALAKMAEYWPFDEVTQDGKYYWGEDNYFSTDANDAYVYAYNGSTYLNYFGSMPGESDKTVVIGENFFLGIFSRVAIFCGYAEDEDGLKKKCIGLIPFTDHSDPVCFAFDDGERISYKNQYYGTYGSPNAFNQYTKILYGATKYTIKDLQIMLTWQYRPTDPGAECTLGDDQAYLYSSVAALAKTPTAHAAPPLEFESDGSNLKNWAIFGNDPGVGEQTKNLVQVPDAPLSSQHLTFTPNRDTGEIVPTRTGEQTNEELVFYRVTLPAGSYIFTCNPDASFSTYDSFVQDETHTIARDNPNISPGNNFTLSSETRVRITHRIRPETDITNLVFRPMIRPADTSSDFEPYGYKIPVETRERGKNYANVETGTTSAGVTFTFDHNTGTVTANGTATGSAQCRVCFNDPDIPNNSTVPPGNYYFSGTPTGGGGGTYNCFSWDNDTNARSKMWDGTTSSEQDNGQGNCQVQINGHRQSIVMRIAPGYTANNVVFKPMLRAADTSSDFEPYWKVADTTNIYTQTQLRTGDTITEEQTGVDIPTVDGENYITVATTTQPAAMTIAYAEPEPEE